MKLAKAGARQFLALLDCPSSYAGQSGLSIRVKLDETGLEFVTAAAPAGNVTGPATTTDNALARWDGAVGGLIQDSGIIVDDSENITGVNSIEINNAGFKIKDTDASHTLAIVPGSNLSANRTFTLTTGDANRTLTLGGDVSFGGAVSVPSALTISAQTLTLTLTGATNVTLPTSGTLATLSNKIHEFTAPTASLSMNSQLITNLLDPVSAQDGCTKGYADAIASGLTLKTSCRVATTADLNATYSATPNFTLTCNVNGAIVIDTISLSVGNRVLVKNQATTTQNGIYSVTTVGTAGTPFVLTRATDADISAEIVSGIYTFITNGPTNQAKGFVLTTADPITLDTTGLDFTQFSSAGQFTAGNGLLLTGSSFSVVASTGITVSAGGVAVDFAVVQAIDAGLTALAAFNTNGFVVQTANNVFAGRTLTSLDGITITDGNGTSGNPAIGVSINSLTQDTIPDFANDYAMTYDASAAALKKVLLRDIGAAGSSIFHQVGTSPLECWYLNTVSAGTLTTRAMAVASAVSTTIYATPYIEGKGGTLDRMAINVNVAVANTTVRFGIYTSTSNSNLYPNTLVVDAGEVDSSTVGTKAQTIAATLDKGQHYWIVLWCTNTAGVATGPTIRAVNSAYAFPTLGISSALGTLPSTMLALTGQTYGALPATFPAGASVTTASPFAAAIRYSA